MAKKKKKANKRKYKNQTERAIANGWSGSELPGHGSVFRRFYPNL